MLFLIFKIGSDRYALPARQVREVLPLLDLKAIPRSPAGVAGLFSYHGCPVPVLDLSAFALGLPARASLSTRIILTEYYGRLLGLMAEHATEMTQCEDRDFVEPGFAEKDAPWLGRVSMDQGSVLQRVKLESLFPEAVRDQLFAAVEDLA